MPGSAPPCKKPASPWLRCPLSLGGRDELFVLRARALGADWAEAGNGDKRGSCEKLWLAAGSRRE
eukprot:2955374-Alexandrium_andersonii.AAC.1